MNFSKIISLRKLDFTFAALVVPGRTLYIKKLMDRCKENQVGLLRTVGVVFSDDEKRQTQYIK